MLQGIHRRISDEQEVQTLFAGCFGYSDDDVWYLPVFIFECKYVVRDF